MFKSALVCRAHALELLVYFEFIKELRTKVTLGHLVFSLVHFRNV